MRPTENLCQLQSMTGTSSLLRTVISFGYSRTAVLWRCYLLDMSSELAVNGKRRDRQGRLLGNCRPRQRLPLSLVGEKLPGERQPYVMARCPVAKEDFRPSECPVCLTEINKRRRWVELRCKHGLCKTCLWRLVRAQGEGSMCPLCRKQLCAYLNEIRAADSATPGAATAAAEPAAPVVGFPVVLASVEAQQPATPPLPGVCEASEGTTGAATNANTRET